MKMWHRLVVCLIAVVTTGVGCGGTRALEASPDRGLLTIDRLLDIKHPSSPSWSPDGTRLAYVWDASGVQNIWMIDQMATAPSSPRALTTFTAGDIDRPFWSRDGHVLYFVHEGDLWSVPADGKGAASAVWKSPKADDQVALSPDGMQIAFVRGGGAGAADWQRVDGDLWVRSLSDGREHRLTEGIGVVSSPTWSPDGAHVAFAVSTATPRSEAPAYSGAKILYSRVDHGPSTPAVVPVSGGKVTTFTASPGWDAAPSWLDASRFVYQRLADDNKTRELIVADVRTRKTQVVYREVDPKFWSLSFVAADLAASPDGRWAAFVSDKDGWDHLYVVSTTGGEAAQVTHGTFEVRNFAWAPDSRPHRVRSQPCRQRREQAVGSRDVRPDDTRGATLRRDARARHQHRRRVCA